MKTIIDVRVVCLNLLLMVVVGLELEGHHLRVVIKRMGLLIAILTAQVCITAFDRPRFDESNEYAAIFECRYPSFGRLPGRRHFKLLCLARPGKCCLFNSC